jgi:thioredoxin-related protein
MKGILSLLFVFGIVFGCIGGESESSPPTTAEQSSPPATETWSPEAPTSATSPPEQPRETSIEWVETVDKAKERAKTEEKEFIYIDFNADSCGWCRKLEEETYEETDVITLINEHFVPVFFDLDIESNQKIYMENYHRYVGGSLPTILILNSDGKALYRIVGYHPGEELIKLLNMALEG